MKAEEWRKSHLTEFPYQLGTTDDGTYMQCATRDVDDLLDRYAREFAAEQLEALSESVRAEVVKRDKLENAGDVFLSTKRLIVRAAELRAEKESKS